jgi:hypothetical protein
MHAEREVIRRATAADIPALGALFEEVFGEKRPESVWRWKYFDNPRGSASYVCEASGRLVAHCGGVPVAFRDYADSYRAFQSVDFMSSPGHAGGAGRGGVFVRTVEAFFADFCGPAATPLVYGFPGERHRLLGERVLGYRPVERIVELGGEPEADGVADLEPLTARVLHLLASLPVPFGAVRDERYLRWRYVDHPVRSYAALVVRKGLWRRAEIAAIVGVENEAVNVMEVGGALTPGAAADLVRALRRLGRQIRFWCAPGHPIGQLFRSAGLVPVERDHYLECRYFIARATPSPGEFYYTLGDYDVY